ncbi:MAG: prephenate dehydrogenase/arogenate dehydrogenase family protein [Dissulfurispiraceae bacterium]|jgi:prephenate dehydrogenase|nr:prephenate dehydrogenase/arogenate dehydrogenase family protein [Dissulfurispiraceae bacterium]
MPLLFDKVALMGVGLIGASLAKAMKVRGLCGSITGYGRNIDNLERASAEGIIDNYTTTPQECCKDADLIVLASPPAVFGSLVREARHSFKNSAIVTDVGSIKGKTVFEMESLMPPDVHFVGAHPIAGSEKTGIAGSSPDLFNGALCLITPTQTTNKSALERVSKLWSTTGAVVEFMDPFRHDEVYAAVSHFPHIIAYELVNAVADADPEFLKYAGRGFRDTTRIAMSSPELWRDISILNSEELLRLISLFRKRLDDMAYYLRDKNGQQIEAEFSKARALRSDLDSNACSQGEE